MYWNEEGITLIELLATIAFIGIILVTSTLIFTNSVQVGKITDRRNQALNLAEAALESLQNYNYTSNLLTAGDHPYNLTGVTPGYTIKYTVADPAPGDTAKWDKNGKPLLKTFTVTVNWTDGKKARQLQLTTYRAKKTL